jgi:hypothetical protein
MWWGEKEGEMGFVDFDFSASIFKPKY